jgi:queuine tRNA-ribosyltransferase
MPDATRAFVKSLSRQDLEAVGVIPMVVNTYHLFLNPGMDLMRHAGGVHEFMNWPHPLLSDSGGYQVFSLVHKNPKMGKITEDEVIFHSPASGKKNVITPEISIQIQFDLGVDMMVCFDDVPPNGYSKEKIAAAVERTIRWAARCKAEYARQIKLRKIEEHERPLLFGVIQGGEYLDLRKYCAEELAKIGFDGYGFGARHVSEDGVFLEEVMRETASYIPDDAIRFALGVGTPEDIVRCFSYGWDIFDCVIPTREGRHGRIFLRKNNFEFRISNFESNLNDKISNDKKNTKTAFYETININNGKFKEDFGKVDEACDCELCKNHTKSYLHHLFSSRDPLGMRLASAHNLKFYIDLMETLRDSV